MPAEIAVGLTNLRLVYKSVKMRGKAATPNTAIRAVREALGLTQEEFGRRASIPQSTIARLEAGDIRTSASHAEKLVAAFGQSVRDYFPATEGFGPDDDAQLAARAAVVARRLAGDNERVLPLVAGLAYVFLDLERRSQSVSDDEETLGRIEAVLRRYRHDRHR